MVSGFGKKKRNAGIVSILAFQFGPSDRIRTCGILLPKQARYQLRYTRLFSFLRGSACIPKAGALSTAPHPVIALFAVSAKTAKILYTIPMPFTIGVFHIK